MAKFQFKLQSVLDYREVVEEQKKTEYGKEIIKKQEIQEGLCQLGESIDNLINETRQGVKSVINPHELKLYHDYMTHLKAEVVRQEQALVEQEIVVEKHRHLMVQAMTERKSVELLKERHLLAYKEEQKKAEQLTTDSIVSFRYTAAR